MLASRSATEGEGFVACPYYHLGIRCEHRQSEWARIVEYPVPALNRFSAGIVATEEGRCGESDAIVRKFDSFKSHFRVARPPNHLCHTLSGWTDR